MRESNVTRLGQGVEACGGLAPGAIAATMEVIAGYGETIERLAPERAFAIATSAVRDSANGAQFLEDVEGRFGIETRLLDGETEARLSYAGATAGRGDGSVTLVIDIGGGSTELIVGSAGEVVFRDSLRLGVVRHGERHIAGDPPADAELGALAEDARGEIRAALSRAGELPDVETGIAVAGTPTSLAAIDLGLEPYDPERVHGHVLSAARIDVILGELASVAEAERRAIPGLSPARAPTIVAGTVILRCVIDAFGLDEIEVSEHDLLWGAALDAAA